MKKITIMAAVAAVLSMVSCNNKEQAEKLQSAEAQNVVLQGEIGDLVATQDSLLTMFNDITEGMNQIKELEKIISTPGGLDGETPSRKEQIKNDIAAIQKALEERRVKLEELEKKLETSTSDNSTLKNQVATLKKTIASLKTQIASQQTEIAQLTNDLAAANVKIAELGNTVTEQSNTITTLNETVANETREREIAQKESDELAQELNTCYYCIGSKNELKANGILEKKFLGKTKVMKGDYNLSYFTKGDKRTLTTINTHNKKCEIMTNMPADSYTIEDVNGEKVIKITNPTKFWSLSNFLVIKVG